MPHPMPFFGYISLLLALALCVYTLLAGALALWSLSHDRPLAVSAVLLRETARRAGIASFLAVSCAAFALVWASFTNDFSVEYILHHTNRALHPAYKFSALWSGQEGSLLLWAWLLAAYGFVLRLRHKVDVTLSAYASTILAAIQIFFLLLLNFSAPPFSIAPGRLASDGFGLNPLLQYPEMVIHPPMLYLGYVGFSVPFAFALGALMMRYPGEKWIHITRKWTMVTWLFLTCGITLGAHWAYAVLGWGGYWGWDPVENASFLPWLTGTAFLHSVMMQEKRGMMKAWNVWLIFLTFMLSILGTLLTRSGIVSSVHAFAQSSIGNWFTAFLIIIFAVCLFTFFYQRDHLKTENRLESLVSRESSFLFNNLILLLACFTVLWGTLFPVLSEFYDGSKVTMGPPYFNRVMVPIGLLLILLTGVGPLLPWRSTSLRAVRRNFVLPCIAVLVAAVVLMACGVRPWQDDDASGGIYALLCFSFSAGVITAITSEFLRGAGVVRAQSSRNLLASSLLLVRRNTRRYGGYLIHFGVIVMFIGLAGAAFNQSKELEMGFGDTLQIGNWRVVCQSYSQDSNANYDTDYALLDVYNGSRKVTQLNPERRFYTASQTTSTMVAIHHTLARDLYVVFEGRNPDSSRPIIKVFLNPLVNWIWVGAFIVILGTGIALVPPLKPATRRAEARETVSNSVVPGLASETWPPAAPPDPPGGPLVPKRVLQVLAICLFAVTMMGADTSTTHIDKLGHKLVCQCGCGQILSECNHVGCPVSPVMLEELKAQVAQGVSDKGTLQFFINKYGPIALAAPMRGGFDNVAWIVPAVVLILATFGVAFLIRFWKRRHDSLHPAIAAAPASPASPTDETLSDRIRRETDYSNWSDKR